MTDRDVLVRIRCDVIGYKRDLQAGSAATAQFGRDVDRLDGPLGRLESRAGSAGNEIDRLSGRLRLAMDVATGLAPAVTGIGAAGLGGLALLTAEVGALAGGLGVTLLATNGLGDALKAIDAYQLERTPENLAKVREELDRLGPAGEQFALYLDSIEPELKSLQLAARAGLLPGAQQGIDDALEKLPRLRTLISEMSTQMGDLAADAGGGLAGGQLDDFLDYLERDGVPILDDTVRTLGNLALAGVNVVAAFAPVQRDFGGGLLDWSRGIVKASRDLDENAGFRELLAYIQETGPEAVETLGAIANAALQIVEATAPLAGPVLQGLESVSDVVSTIADSDIGTPLFAGAAALALYNRAMAVTVKLQQTAAANPKSVTGIIGGNVQSQLDGLKTLPSAYREATSAQQALTAAQDHYTKSASTYVGQLQIQNRLRAEGYTMSAAAEARLADSLGRVQMAQYGVTQATDRARVAEGKRSELMRGTALQAGKAAGFVGGLAFATSGLAEDIGLSNTASMAMLGTLGGPWGAAIGGAIGLVMDLGSSQDDTAAKVADLTATFDAQTGAITDNTRVSIANDLQQQGMLDAAEKLGITTNTLTESIMGSASAQQHLNDALAGYDVDHTVTSVEDLRKSFSEQEVQAILADRAATTLRDGLPGLSSNFSTAAADARQLAEAAHGTSGQTNDLRAAFDATADAAGGLNSELEDLDGVLSRRSAYRGYQAALDQLRDSLKESPKAWSVFGDAGRTNLANLDSIVESAKQNLDELVDRPRARAAFLDDVMAQLATISATSPEAAAAVAQILPELQAVQSANTDLVIKADNADALKKAAQASEALHDLATARTRPRIEVEAGNSLSLLTQLRSLLDNINGRVSTATIRVNRIGPPGSSVTSTAGGHSAPDPSDVVGSPRRGRLSELVEYGRPRLSDLAAGRTSIGPLDPRNVYTRRSGGGGEFGSQDLVATFHAVDVEGRSAATGLKGLKKRLEESQAALAKEKTARDNARSARDAFASQVGGAYSKADLFAGGLSEFDAGTSANTNDTLAAQAALAAAAGKGLDGLLYQALAGSGNLLLLQQIAGLTAQQIDQREIAFGNQSAAQTGLGESAAATAGLTATVNRLDKVVKDHSQAVRELSAEVKQMGDRVEKGSEAGARAGTYQAGAAKDARGAAYAATGSRGLGRGHRG